MKDAKNCWWVDEFRWVDTDQCVSNMLTKPGSKLVERARQVKKTVEMFRFKKKKTDRDEPV